TSSHRKAMLRNMAASLFEHGQITTTLPKAKALQPFVEKIVTKAKRGDLHARRQVISMLGGDRNAFAWSHIPKNATEDERASVEAMRERSEAFFDIPPAEAIERNRYGELRKAPKLVRHLFENVAPRFEDREGGYTRIVKLGRRRLGDQGELVVIQFVGALPRPLDPLKQRAPAPDVPPRRHVNGAATRVDRSSLVGVVERLKETFVEKEHGLRRLVAADSGRGRHRQFVCVAARRVVEKPRDDEGLGVRIHAVCPFADLLGDFGHVEVGRASHLRARTFQHVARQREDIPESVVAHRLSRNPEHYASCARRRRPERHRLSFGRYRTGDHGCYKVSPLSCRSRCRERVASRVPDEVGIDVGTALAHTALPRARARPRPCRQNRRVRHAPRSFVVGAEEVLVLALYKIIFFFNEPQRPGFLCLDTRHHSAAHQLQGPGVLELHRAVEASKPVVFRRALEVAQRSRDLRRGHLFRLHKIRALQCSVLLAFHTLLFLRSSRVRVPYPQGQIYVRKPTDTWSGRLGSSPEGPRRSVPGKAGACPRFPRVGRGWPGVGQGWPELARSWPGVGPELARSWPEVVPESTRDSQGFTELAWSWPELAWAGPGWPELVRVGPDSSRS
ncbi:MAG: 50S ribosomal protein L17, partial [Planctomycetota bacterium]